MVKIFYLLCFLGNTNAANILFFTVAPAVSHQLFFQPIYTELAARGHNVTAIVTKPLHEKIPNLHEIDISFTFQLVSEAGRIFSPNNWVIINIFFFFTKFRKLIETVFENQNVMHAITSTKYDLIILEDSSPLIFAVTNSSVPIIVISSFGGTKLSHWMVNNPVHPVLNPSIFFQGEVECFWDRLSNTALLTWTKLFYYLYEIPMCDKSSRKYFAKYYGQNLPYLGDTLKRLSILIINASPLMQNISPDMPSVVKVFNVKFEGQKNLPQDIQEFMNKSKNGVIYCSFGTNINCTKNSEFYTNLKSVFEYLPYNIIWKCNTEEMTGNKFYVKDWLPQREILEHPNIKLFITQGGLHSIEEAIETGVPIIGLPIYSDQRKNVLKAVDLGIGLKGDFYSITSEKLKDLIMEVTGNQKYKNNVMESRKIFKDQPTSGLNKSIWWIEYVLRNKGALYLKGSAGTLPWYQFYLLDFFALLLIIVLAIIIIIYKLVRILMILLNRRIRIKLN